LDIEKILSPNTLTVISTFTISSLAFMGVYLEYKKKKLQLQLDNGLPLDKNTKQIKQSFNISFLLMTLLNDCGADRVYVYLLDKNKNNYLDTFSCEYEFVTLGTSSEIFNTKITIEKHKKFFQDLENKKELIYYDVENLPSPTKEFFIDRGNQSAGFIILVDKDNRFEGFLGLDFTKEKLDNSEKIKTLLLKASEQINYKINEQRESI
jgi:hypothetical protein